MEAHMKLLEYKKSMKLFNGEQNINDYGTEE